MKIRILVQYVDEKGMSYAESVIDEIDSRFYPWQSTRQFARTAIGGMYHGVCQAVADEIKAVKVAGKRRAKAVGKDVQR